MNPYVPFCCPSFMDIHPHCSDSYSSNYCSSFCEVLAWLSDWSEVQMICIWSSWCHCHPIISCSSKILEKRPLHGSSSSSSSTLVLLRRKKPETFLWQFLTSCWHCIVDRLQQFHLETNVISEIANRSTSILLINGLKQKEVICLIFAVSHSIKCISV